MFRNFWNNAKQKSFCLFLMILSRDAEKAQWGECALRLCQTTRTQEQHSCPAAYTLCYTSSMPLTSVGTNTVCTHMT